MNRRHAVLFLIAGAAIVHADFTTGFEAPDYSGSSGGVVVTGQQGWTMPSGTDQKVYTYQDNALGFVQNPTGGDQFMAGRSPGSSVYARAEHGMDFSGRDVWTMGYDIAALYDNTVTATDNIGSFSLQPSASARSFTAVDQWMDPATHNAWQINFIVCDAAGTQYSAYQSPGDAWANLQLNHWYRMVTVVDFTTNKIASTTIYDLMAGTHSTFVPDAWYLTGGASPSQPMPTAFRYFVGGNTAGNTVGVDNVSLVPEPATLLIVGAGAGLLALRRRKALR